MTFKSEQSGLWTRTADDGGTPRAFALARFAFSIQAATSSASFVRRRESQAFGAAILPLPAGTLTQLEMFQKRLNVLGKTLGHTPSLGVFCWLEVTDFDRLFGFLFLVLHVCYLSFANSLIAAPVINDITDWRRMSAQHSRQTSVS
jgi:hypothetical protein